MTAGEYQAFAFDGAGIGAPLLNNVAASLAQTETAFKAQQYSSLSTDAIKQ